MNPLRPPTKYALEVEETWSIGDVRRKLAEIVRVRERSLLMCLVRNNVVQKYLLCHSQIPTSLASVGVPFASNYGAVANPSSAGGSTQDTGVFSLATHNYAGDRNFIFAYQLPSFPTPPIMTNTQLDVLDTVKNVRLEFLLILSPPTFPSLPFLIPNLPVFPFTSSSLLSLF